MIKNSIIINLFVNNDNNNKQRSDSIRNHKWKQLIADLVPEIDKSSYKPDAKRMNNNQIIDQL